MRGIVLATWTVLFVTQVLWWGWLSADNPVPRAVLIFICAGPLLLPLRGLLHDRPRAYFWFNLLLMPYFSAAVAALYAAGGSHPIAWIQLLATVAGFGAGFMVTRQARTSRTAP